ncbi:endonuclease/exonuclease/phosphatase family protein [Bizionia myxarmorum]|uniref:Endonuclease/exonuclease/phosphatase family protein n=1 Tax=Bizionia myxarmorum TaxID=291186 RepID=A0A5D0QZF2_9FLAO|nr:endonuclease/exonuclease/phosphatase family protein [Bizionia myxarmorum]TYB73996.1 endonuclease/exonuclease/phosphatase family protein [Bizionia myxarmorum]
MNKFYSFFYVFLALVFSCNSSFNQANLFNEKSDVKNEIAIVEMPQMNGDLKANSSENLKLISWNNRHLGRTKSAETLYDIASILRDYDIVAIQEVVAKDPAGAQAVAKIADELNRMGSKWDYQISNPTKSPSVYMSERYAFLWKTAKVNIVGRAYLDAHLEELCYREPFVATFKLKGKSDPFYVVNYHSRKFNDNPHEEIIHFIDFPERLNSNRILIAGDFNLNEKHAVWKPFYKKGFKSALENERTTLKTICKHGDYRSHAIDNIYFTSDIEKLQAKPIDFVGNCENLEVARKISDHLPVLLEFKLK